MPERTSTYDPRSAILRALELRERVAVAGVYLGDLLALTCEGKCRTEITGDKVWAVRLEATLSNIEVGQFIQLKTWFGDVWAEVVKSYGDWFFYVSYEKYGGARQLRDSRAGYVRRVATREELEPQRAIIMYAANQYRRYGAFTDWHPVNPDMGTRRVERLNRAKEVLNATD